jgi:hypothetical protein
VHSGISEWIYESNTLSVRRRAVCRPCHQAGIRLAVGEPAARSVEIVVKQLALGCKPKTRACG